MSLDIVIFPSPDPCSWSSSAAPLWSTEGMVVTNTSGLVEPWLDRREAWSIPHGLSVGLGPVGESGPWSPMLVDRKLDRRLISSMSPQARSLFIAVVGLSGISRFLESWSGYLLRWSSYFRLGCKSNLELYIFYAVRRTLIFYLLKLGLTSLRCYTIHCLPSFIINLKKRKYWRNEATCKIKALLWWVAHKAFHDDVGALHIAPHSEFCGFLPSWQPVIRIVLWPYLLSSVVKITFSFSLFNLEACWLNCLATPGFKCSMTWGTWDLNSTFLPVKPPILDFD